LIKEALELFASDILLTQADLRRYLDKR